jgi:formylglycine-generating enzyme required for sulfatase activity
MTESLVLAAGAAPVAGYTLVRLLGRGGFGEVWEARAPGDFHVALKFLRLETREADMEQRALEVIRNLRHGHLLDVQFATRVADCMVIAMPLCDQSLLDRLNACRAAGWPGVPRNELLRYMDELARAVDYLNEPRHRAEDGTLVGVQHRDIKPHNVFLVGGSVRLADFGMAKILAAMVASTRGRMTPSYAAPEVIEGRFSRWSDQYSLAATYCELRTGRPPFEGENALQIMYAHVNRVPELVGIPIEERKAVARALAKRPEKRWPTCRDFVRALNVAAREDDRRATAPTATLVRPAVAPTKLPETQAPPPIPLPRIDDADPLGVLARVMNGRPRGARLGVLAVLLAVLAGALVFSRLGQDPVVPLADTEPPPVVSTRPEPKAALPPTVVLAEFAQPVPSDPGPVAAASVPPSGPMPKTIANTIGMTLVLIPAGEFLMGSPDSDKDANADEKPQLRLRITRPSYLGATEVTRGQYRAVTGEYPSLYKGSDDLPVDEVSWNEAIAFCNKLSARERLKPYYQFGGGAQSGGDGYRLPTEAEWEYACRAGTTTRFGAGDADASLGEYAWFYGNAKGGPHPVGRKRPNAWGLYDMHGNVFEWCWDRYEEKYYAISPGADPLGPSQTTGRVFRGGSWDSGARHCRAAARSGLTPVLRGSLLGFRVARSGP